MSPEIVAGLGIGILICFILIPWIVMQLRDFSAEGYEGERWGRYAYEVRRTGSYVDSGTSYRLADTSRVSLTAREILEEWFIRENILSSDRAHFECLVRLQEEEQWAVRVSAS